MPLAVKVLSRFRPAASTEPAVASIREAAPVACTSTWFCAPITPLLAILPCACTWLSPPAYTVPLLATSPVTAMLVWLPAPADWILPLLLNQPFDCSTRLPAVAATTPALRTPRPASVPIRVILPAYMPPSCATSSA
ncbi:hypothetical protein D3C81_805300 [compost metagenome]